MDKFRSVNCPECTGTEIDLLSEVVETSRREVLGVKDGVLQVSAESETLGDVTKREHLRCGMCNFGWFFHKEVNHV